MPGGQPPQQGRAEQPGSAKTIATLTSATVPETPDGNWRVVTGPVGAAARRPMRPSRTANSAAGGERNGGDRQPGERAAERDLAPARAREGVDRGDQRRQDQQADEEPDRRTPA